MLWVNELRTLTVNSFTYKYYIMDQKLQYMERILLENESIWPLHCHQNTTAGGE